ncbi:MAG: type 4a pilus biogenesis protein PilO [Desulfobulbaceae bacterium]|nr:type 4a pilus biogenesis protein PilO [Desulfobulbaceae bacterium]MCK5545219.1 type 4a pilus biogenesis protein PilO [Desulfobulbaceae bacterium]
MIDISRIIDRFGGKKSLLIGMMAVLLALKVGQLTMNHFDELAEQVSNREALLDQYYRTSKKLVKLKADVDRAEKRKEQLDVFLFSGESAEEISSAMQIRLQEQVIKAGLEPESIRPSQGREHKERDYGEVAVKMRLSGSLNGFIKFLADLNRSQQLFIIEGFTLKSYKKTKLKIFMELKGYYLLKKEKA